MIAVYFLAGLLWVALGFAGFLYYQDFGGHKKIPRYFVLLAVIAGPILFLSACFWFMFDWLRGEV